VLNLRADTKAALDTREQECTFAVILSLEIEDLASARWAKKEAMVVASRSVTSTGDGRLQRAHTRRAN